jgi:hypothetical protein
VALLCRPDGARLRGATLPSRPDASVAWIWIVYTVAINNCILKPQTVKTGVKSQITSNKSQINPNN